jgi:predicted ATP-grasp superfamily ATP-dependent carboligase
MPRYETKTIKELGWFDTPFVLQFNHSHTGSGTIYIDSKKKLQELQEKFPKRDCRIAPFIEGPIFTSNIVVGGDAVIPGNMSYQITGVAPFTDLAFATIGNDWGAPYRILTESAITSYNLLATEVAKTLAKLGWKGLFGIDAIWSTKENKWYMIEINARQAASASYESELQFKIKKDDSTLTMLEAHLKALLGEPLHDYSLIKISDGAQIIQRVTKETIWQQQIKDAAEKLSQKKFRVIAYENTEHNSDLLRIQSEKSIIETDGGFTDIGKEIKNVISN